MAVEMHGSGIRSLKGTHVLLGFTPVAEPRYRSRSLAPPEAGPVHGTRERDEVAELQG